MTDLTPRSPIAPPLVGEDPDMDQLLFDVFVTAIEGGVNAWATTGNYHWTNDAGATDDLEGFWAYIQDIEDEEAPLHRIDRDVIYRGLVRAASGDIANDYLTTMVDWALNHPEAADVDGDGADVIVQAGIFGSLVYS